MQCRGRPGESGSGSPHVGASKAVTEVELKTDQTVARQAPALPRDCARLIQKLRWIGLHEQATRLESAISTLPPDERCELSFEPTDTD